MSSTGGGIVVHNSATSTQEIKVTVDGVEKAVPPDNPIYAAIADWFTSATPPEQGEPEGE